MAGKTLNIIPRGSLLITHLGKAKATARNGFVSTQQLCSSWTAYIVAERRIWNTIVLGGSNNLTIALLVNGKKPKVTISQDLLTLYAELSNPASKNQVL